MGNGDDVAREAELREEMAGWLENAGYPQFAHAHRITGWLILTEDDRRKWGAADLAEWDAAVASYEP